jgi:hypothetical protein
MWEKILKYFYSFFYEIEKEDVINRLEKALQKIKDDYEKKEKIWESRLIEQEETYNVNLEKTRKNFEDLKCEITFLMEENKQLMQTMEIKTQIIDKQDKKIMKVLIDLNKIETESKEKINQLNKCIFEKIDEIEEMSKVQDKIKDEYEYLLDEYKNIEYKYDTYKSETEKKMIEYEEKINYYECQQTATVSNNFKKENELLEMINTLKFKVEEIENANVNEVNEKKLLKERNVELDKVNNDLMEEYNKLKVENELIKNDIMEMSSKKKSKNKKNKKL